MPRKLPPSNPTLIAKFRIREDCNCSLSVLKREGTVRNPHERMNPLVTANNNKMKKENASDRIGDSLGVEWLVGRSINKRKNMHRDSESGSSCISASSK
mmetsp:Transcript_25895/g.39190  ORF Transcript_25895/g.39190 Transcript_25895/m.39190 type:complete len:99 (-) Transcript_25895:489-785(-)